MGSNDAQQQFATVINRVDCKEIRVVVEKRGVPVAGVVSAEDLQRLGRLA